MSDLALVLLVVLPATVGAVLALTPRAERWAAPVSLVTSGLGVGLAVAVALARPAVAMPFVSSADFGMRVDGLAAVMVPTVAVVTFLVLVFSASEIRQSQPRFHGLMLLFAASAALTATASSLVSLLFAWELMGATSFALIGFWWRDDDRVFSAQTAFLTTRTADLGMYVAAGAALAGGAGLALDDLAAGSAGWRSVVAAGLLVAALGKAAQLPFSFWLSRAMAGPSPVSALLHSAAMVALGGYLLLRVEPLLAATGWALPVAAWVGAGTAVLLGVVAVAQSDLKQLLAASTSAQIGFVVMAAGVGSVTGGTVHLVGHAATKAALFLAAGAWLSALGTKRLAGLAGVARSWPWVGWSVGVAGLALAGVPPLSLWATKESVIAAAKEESGWLYAAGLIAAALSAAYAAKIVWVVWRLPAGGQQEVDRYRDEEEPGTGKVGVLAQVPVGVLAVAAAVLVALALPPLFGRLAGALGESEGARSTVLDLVVAGLLALVVVAVVARWRPPEPRWAHGWLGLERAAHLLVVAPMMRVAGALARFDDRVLDRGVDAVAAGVLRSAAGSARVDAAGVDAAVERLGGWVRGLGELARRPQTGQLYQYYLQAVVVVVAGAVLLVVVR